MRKRTPPCLLIGIDPRSGEGLQQQVYAGIRRTILDGVVSPGTRLPSSRSLASDLGVSRTTTMLAMEQLLAEGYVTATSGSGTFVAHDLPDDLRYFRRARPATEPRHPSLSRRAAVLAAIPPPALRIEGPPRPFRVGTPALDLFPVETWSRLVGRRLRSVTSVQLDYGAFHPLKEAIAAHVQAARGTRCTPDQVLVVAGTQRGLDLMCRLLLDPLDAAWVEDPGYPGARGTLTAAGARIVPVPVDGEGLDVDAGLRLAPEARLVYVTPSHQFPSGAPMSLRRRLALLRWAARAGAWVVEDDYDSDFRYGARPIPCLHGLDDDGRVIYLGTFSKCLFPALRLGFLIVPPDLKERLRAARLSIDLHPQTLDQAVLADFMADGHFERHLRRMRAVYKERLEALTDGARRFCDGALRLRPVCTGLHAVADLEGTDDRRVHLEATARGVEVTPLSAFFLDRSRAQNGLLLGFGAVRPEALLDGMKRLAAAVEAAGRPSTLEHPKAARG